MTYKVQPLRSDFPGETLDDKINYVLSLPVDILSSLSDGDLLKCFALLHTKTITLAKTTIASELRAVRRPYDAKISEIKSLFRFDSATVMFLMTDLELNNFTVNFNLKKSYLINPVVDPLKMIAFLPLLKTYLTFDYDKFQKDIGAGNVSQEFVAEAERILGIPFMSVSSETVMLISSKSFVGSDFNNAVEVK